MSSLSEESEQNGIKSWSLMHCTEPNCLKLMCKVHRPIKKRPQKELGWYQQGFKFQVRVLEGQSAEKVDTVEKNTNIVQQGGFSGGVKIVPIVSENLQGVGPEDDIQLDSHVEHNADGFNLMDGAEDDEIERAREVSDAESDESLDDNLVIDLSTSTYQDQNMDEENVQDAGGVENVEDNRPLSPFSSCSTLSFSTDDEISEALKIKLDTDMIEDKAEGRIEMGTEHNNEENGVELNDVKLILNPESYDEFETNPNVNENEPMDIDENPVVVEVVEIFPAVRKSKRLSEKFKSMDEGEVNAKAKKLKWITRHCKNC